MGAGAHTSHVISGGLPLTPVIWGFWPGGRGLGHSLSPAREGSRPGAMGRVECPGERGRAWRARRRGGPTALAAALTSGLSELVLGRLGDSRMWVKFRPASGPRCPGTCRHSLPAAREGKSRHVKGWSRLVLDEFPLPGRHTRVTDGLQGGGPAGRQRIHERGRCLWEPRAQR